MAKVVAAIIVSSIALWNCAASQICENEYVAAYTEKIQTATKEVIDGIQSDVLDVPVDGINQSTLYSALSEVHNITESPKGHEDFTVALDAITDAYFIACYGLEEDRPTAQDAPGLVQEFLTILASNSTFADISRMREIFGQLTCLKNFSANGDAEKKRDATIELLTKCGGKTSLKNLYECLDESLQQCIFSLNGNCVEGNNNDLPTSCIGFVIDTTGSMGEEIADARTVITNLVQSEANGDIRCYVLVGFNDFGDDSNLYNSKFDLITIYSAYTTMRSGKSHP